VSWEGGEDERRERWRHYAALPLRIVVGCAFVVLGLQRIAGYFGGPGLSATAEIMASAGFTSGAFWAWVAGLESLAAIVAAASATNLEFRLAALAVFVALLSWGRSGTRSI
jgi:putative oxidoreductase